MHVILLDSAFIPMSFVSWFRTGERVVNQVRFWLQIRPWTRQLLVLNFQLYIN